MPIAYKILDYEGKPNNGGHGVWYLPTKNDDGTWTPGEWMPEIEGELKPCSNGYHLVDKQHILDWAGPELYEAEWKGRRKMHDDKDKFVVRRVRLLRKIETWNPRTLRLFSVWCTREALKLIENPDRRSINAADVAERYANGEATADELTAAYAAAWAAASAAAWDAASVAAWDAAWDATMNKQAEHLIEMIQEAEQ